MSACGGSGGWVVGVGMRVGVGVGACVCVCGCVGVGVNVCMYVWVCVWCVCVCVCVLTLCVLYVCAFLCNVLIPKKGVGSVTISSSYCICAYAGVHIVQYIWNISKLLYITVLSSPTS